MDSRIQVVIGLSTVLLLMVVIDLVRRRRLLERYALLWLLSAVVLLGLAAWRGALDKVAEAIGVASPPNALFIVAFGFVLWLLLHFSVAVSRLNDQSKVLAQRLAIAEEALRELRAERAAGDGVADADERDERARSERVSVP